MMNFQRIAGSLLLSGVVTLASPLAIPGAAMAQSDCTCLLSAPPSGSLGAISEANGDVFKTGANGLEDAGSGALINPGDIITTGASASASVSLGGGCNLAMGPSSQISITPSGGNLCVRLTQEQLTGDNGGGGGGGTSYPIVIAAGLTAGAGLVFGLGLTEPASR